MGRLRIAPEFRTKRRVRVRRKRRFTTRQKLFLAGTLPIAFAIAVGGRVFRRRR